MPFLETLFGRETKSRDSCYVKEKQEKESNAGKKIDRRSGYERKSS